MAETKIKATAEDMEHLLRKRHTRSNGMGGGMYAFATHVRSTAGTNEREFDAVALHVWPSQGLRLDVFEIKVSRSDLRRELSMPWKSKAALDVADHFWLVTPKGLSAGIDIPHNWGILEATSTLSSLRLVRNAPALREYPMWGGLGNRRTISRDLVVGMLQADATILGRKPREGSRRELVWHDGFDAGYAAALATRRAGEHA